MKRRKVAPSVQKKRGPPRYQKEKNLRKFQRKAQKKVGNVNNDKVVKDSLRRRHQTYVTI